MARKAKRYGANIIEDPRRPGRFYVRVYHGGRRYKRRAASLSHARELVHEIKAAIAKSDWPPKPEAKPALFDALLADYREAKKREGKAIMRTAIGYRRLLEHFGGRRPESITPGEVEAWRDEMMETLSVASVNHHLQLFRAILLRAVENRRLGRDGVPKIKLRNPNNQRVRYLTEAEERGLLDALPEWLRPLAVSAIHTGLRKGELLNLRWSDVDFIGSVIHVREAKSGEGRHVPMNNVVRSTLATLLDARRARLRARVVNRAEAGGFVFSAPGGGFLHDLNRYWYPALKACGIEDLHFHDLRHTFASRLVMNGVDLYRVQTLMGHKTPAMTMRYAHLSPQHLAAAVATLDTPRLERWAEESAGS